MIKVDLKNLIEAHRSYAQARHQAVQNADASQAGHGQRQARLKYLRDRVHLLEAARTIAIERYEAEIGQYQQMIGELQQLLREDATARPAEPAIQTEPAPPKPAKKKKSAPLSS